MDYRDKYENQLEHYPYPRFMPQLANIKSTLRVGGASPVKEINGPV